MNNNLLYKRRLSTKFEVFKNKHFKPIPIIKFIFPVLISIPILLIVSYVSVNISYQNRITSNLEDIPDYLNTSIIVINGEAIEADSNSYTQIVRILSGLYKTRIINKIVFYVLNPSSDTNYKNLIDTSLKDVLAENITVDLGQTTLYNICVDTVEKRNYRSLVFSDTANMIRLLYNCNDIGVYYLGFSPNKEVRYNWISIRNFLEDFLKLNLSR
jgi:hypothetical protein